MSFSGRARRAAEQQQWQRELEGARSLLCQSSSRMLLNSRNAGEHQLAAAEQPAATPRSRRGMQSTYVYLSFTAVRLESSISEIHVSGKQGLYFSVNTVYLQITAWSL